MVIITEDEKVIILHALDKLCGELNKNVSNIVAHVNKGLAPSALADNARDNAARVNKLAEKLERLYKKNFVVLKDSEIIKVIY